MSKPADWAQAQQCFDRAMASHRDGQPERAAELYQQSLRLAPELPDLRSHLGVALCQAGQPDTGLKLLRDAACRAGRQAAMNHVNLAQALADAGRRPEALSALAVARQLEPADLHIARRHVDLLLDDHQPDAALKVASAALEQASPGSRDWAGLRGRQAMALHRLGDIDAALTAHEDALPLLNDNPAAHLNYAYSLLMAGRFEEGWRQHEARLHAALRREIGDRHFTQPTWDGRALDGETVLVHGEQGFGDQFMFGRFVKAIAERGGRPVLVCPQVQAQVMRSLPGVAEVVAPHHRKGQRQFRLDHVAHDYQIALLSLPGVLGVTRENLADPGRYLSAERKATAHWARQLPGEGLRVGLVHAGNPAHANDQNRSMPAAALAPLLGIDGLQFVSLQLGEPAGALARQYPDAAITDLADALTDFSTTAAVLANLDLLIAVDTAVVHLAGAMHLPTWTLLPAVPDWRWGMRGEQTPWYRQMRLFRQRQGGDWSAPVAEAAEALRTLVADAGQLSQATG